MQCTPGTPQFVERAKDVMLLVLDVDGTLTDGAIYVDDAGTEFKKFNVRDGLGIKAWQKAGFQVAILSARDVPCVRHRAAQLGIELVIQGAHNKARGLDLLLRQTGLQDRNVACIGDDWNDVPVFHRANIAVAVPQADRFVQSHATFTTFAPGGGGAVREVVECILDAKGLLESIRLSFAGRGE